jgi:hypothetical protein
VFLTRAVAEAQISASSAAVGTCPLLLLKQDVDLQFSALLHSSLTAPVK